MLLQRVIVAAIGLPLLGLLLWVPEPVFAGVVEAILAVAAFEIMRSVAPRAPLSLWLSAAAATALFVALVRVQPDLPLWAFLLVTAFALAALLWRRTRMGDHIGGWWLAAVLYAGVLGAHIVLIRPFDDGQRWLLLLLAATFITDTAAYAAGRLVGRHRLWPAVSPNKTWEGFAGGLAGGAAAAIAALLLLDLHRAIATEAIVAIAIALPLAAVAGDLLESALKRRMGVKDMSGLLLGHGGFADRIDSVLVAATCLYWIVRWQT